MAEPTTTMTITAERAVHPAEDGYYQVAYPDGLITRWGRREFAAAGLPYPEPWVDPTGAGLTGREADYIVGHAPTDPSENSPAEMGLYKLAKLLSDSFPDPEADDDIVHVTVELTRQERDATARIVVTGANTPAAMARAKFIGATRATLTE